MFSSFRFIVGFLLVLFGARCLIESVTPIPDQDNRILYFLAGAGLFLAGLGCLGW